MYKLSPYCTYTRHGKQQHLPWRRICYLYMEDWPLPTLSEFGDDGVLCTFSNTLAAEQLLVRASCTVHRREGTNRLAMATFWRTFHHDGKFSPAWWGGGVHTHSLSRYLPSRAKLLCTIQPRGQIHFSYFSSTLVLYVMAGGTCHPSQYKSGPLQLSWTERRVGSVVYGLSASVATSLHT